jgi:hypothetical protein
MGATVSSFSNDGTLFIADNQRKRFYRQLPGQQTLRLVATVQSGVLEPAKFSGVILALVARKESSGSEKLIYIEQGEPNEIKSLTLGDAAAISMAKSPGCDLPAASGPGGSCEPKALAIDTNGLVYFFDGGSRTVRRISAPNTFETVAGTGASALGLIGRSAGDSQNAGQMGFSSTVSALIFDRLGNLYVTDPGSLDDCPWGGCEDGAAEGSAGSPGKFLSFISKINLASNSTNDLTRTDVTTILGAGGVASGRINSASLSLNQAINVGNFTPTAINGVSLLPEDTLLFEDAGILMLAKATGNSFSVSRFFGGENNECGFSTVSGAGSSATLGAALGRICLGNVLGLSSFNPCKDNPQDTASIAVSQILSRQSTGYDGGGSVLRLDFQCNSLPNSLGAQ